MLRSIELGLFKCFQILRLPLSELTLLSGTNASGKSTVLQSLVLLHQTMLENEWSTRLHLNGGEIQLGTVTDVVDKVHGRREFRIGIVDDQSTVSWLFQYETDKQSMSAEVASVEVNGQSTTNPKKLRFLLPEGTLHDDGLAARLKRLCYLTAERVGPRDNYRLQDPSVTQVVGPRGENAVGMLHQRRDELVNKLLVSPVASPTLLSQVEARMAQFFPGTSLTVLPVPRANMVTLGITNSGETGFHRPINVGFGLTQVLPIIVASLVAGDGDLLLIENPEVHLHPAGQALMGEFLAEVANAGVQVILESHSDHVLNGIRRAVKRKNIKADQVSLHFFTARGGNSPQVTSPTIRPDGNIDHWPEGFFDQFDKDLNYFAGWGN
jgi:predicted ATPase